MIYLNVGINSLIIIFLNLNIMVFFMDIKNNWKIKYGIIFLIITIIIYGLFIILGMGDSHEVTHYIWLHLGFIPLDLLLLGLIIEDLLSKKEKEAFQEKLDMIVASFFSEMGNDLITKLSSVNSNKISSLESIRKWDLKDYNNALKFLKENPSEIVIMNLSDDKIIFLKDLRELLHNNRSFLVNLINNPNLLEKEEFSALLLAIFHLCDELELREDFTKISKADFNHLKIDVDRVYSNIVYEWVRYLRHLYIFHPYMLSIAIRTNPFDKDASIYVDEE